MVLVRPLIIAHTFAWKESKISVQAMPCWKEMAVLLSGAALGKSFGARILFENLSLSLSEGDRTGLIGPNGSGKTTLMEILAGR